MNPRYINRLIFKALQFVMLLMLMSCDESIETNAFNRAPIADAGANQSISVGDLVTLNGSNSSDLDNDDLTYSWNLQRPAGSNAVLSSINTAAPSFTVDISGSYIASLTVDDGTDVSAVDAVRITTSTSNINTTPVADAGIDQNVTTGQIVSLTGLNSSDAENDNLTFIWILQRPTGSSAVLSGSNTATPSFIADIDGRYTISLIVNDGTALSAVDAVTIISNKSNTAPVADAGADQNITTGQTVSLTGINSSDADDDSLTYSWSLQVPTGSSAVLSAANVVGPVFIADIDGRYTASLTVNDGTDTSVLDTVIVISSTGNSAPVADAGNDAIVITGDVVSLDGSGSSDVNNDSLTFSWSLQVPIGSSAVLSASNVVSPAFTTDIDGSYTASLIVNDGLDISTGDTVTIISNTPNSVPVADAGIDQSVNTGQLVSLTGLNSSDADNDNLTFIWILQRPAGSSAVLSGSNTITPSFIADIDGTYSATLIVNDGVALSTVDTVTITSSTPNTAPVADAGIDVSVNTGDIVNLDGGGSSDANNDSLTFSWSLQLPAGSSAVLSSLTVSNPTFTADVDGSYVASLTVDDGTDTSAVNAVTITSSTPNAVPVANAGVDQNVTTGQTVSLTGLNSSDADNDGLTYSWSLQGPTGSGAVLSASNVVTPSFTADVDGSYIASLTVNDGTDTSAIDTVIITSVTGNSAPVADAGIDVSVNTGDVVNLDGSGSSDVDGDGLLYNWTLFSRPATSNATLIQATSSNPSFTADVEGEFVLTLMVNDGALDSQTDSLIVTSSLSNHPPVSNAGINQNVSTGDTVTLNGEASSDVDNDSLSFSWVLNVPSGSTAALSTNNTVMPTFVTDKDGDYTATLTVNDGVLSSSPDSVLIQSSTAVANDIDTFDGTGRLDWDVVNNESSLPDIARVDGRYRANLIDNTDNITLHFKNDQGRLDAKLISFPFEVIARNIGVGTQLDSQTAPTPNGNPFIFAGVQVHVLDLESRNSSHIVVGHRGGSRTFTIEGKNTVNGTSLVDDIGQGAVPDGRADLRIVGNADRTLTVYWQQSNLNAQADNWQLYDGSNSSGGNLRGTAPNYGASVYVGLITYAQGQDNVPFVGTCDSFEIIN